jgi:RNA polymerase primary sigma factor
VNDDQLQRYLEEAAREPVLSPEEERTLLAEMRAGQPTARDRLIRANMRLVVSIARRYEDPGILLHPLVEWGHSGLERAVDRFDSEKPYKLSSYATWYIRQAITRGLADPPPN